MKSKQKALRYLVRRDRDNRVLVEAETVWVYVDRKNGRPRRIPDELRAAFEVVPADDEIKPRFREAGDDVA